MSPARSGGEEASEASLDLPSVSEAQGQSAAVVYDTPPDPDIGTQGCLGRQSAECGTQDTTLRALS